MRTLIISDHAHVRERFLEEFSGEIDEITATLTQAYSAYRRLEDKVRLDDRSAHVQAFAFTALNSLITSTNLLLSGLQLPSGNLMRQYGEASAMALLCSHPSIDVLARMRKDPHSFPYQNAIEIVGRKRNRRLLGLKAPEWKTFGNIGKFYDRFSHASFFAIASQTMFGQPGMLIVLGEFDPEKIEPYRIEMRRRKTAATVLGHLMDYLSERLPQKKDG